MKKWPISIPIGFFVCIGSVISVAPDRHERQDVHHHCQPIPLVAGILRRPAQRRQKTALFLCHQGIVRRPALGVQHPPVRRRQPFVRLVANPPRRHRRRRHIQQKRHPIGTRRRERPRVGPQPSLLAECRRHLNARGRGAGHPDQPRPRRHQRIEPRRPEMRRLLHHRGRHPRLLRLLNGTRHSEMRRHMPQPAAPIHHRGHGRFPHHRGRASIFARPDRRSPS